MTRRSFVKNLLAGTASVAVLVSTEGPRESWASSRRAEQGGISSLRGYVKPSELGITLMHEHIVWLTPGIRENWPEYFNEKACLEIAKKKLGEVASRGVRTIVDLTPPDAGRDVRLLKKIQDTTSINIILCTGMYWDIPLFWNFKDADEMAAAFIKDITKGIQGSQIKASIIKLATDDSSGGLTDENEKCLRAGARAHRATGAPISTHTGPHVIGLEHQRIFREEGVDLSRVVIGHIGDTTDTDFQKRLMDQGSTIGMDRFGLYGILPNGEKINFENRVDTVSKLCKEGYADRMVLSHDHWCWHDWDFAKVYPDYPWKDHKYTHIPDDVLPALKQRGVSEAQIEQMLVKNPRRIFENQKPY